MKKKHPKAKVLLAEMQLSPTLPHPRTTAQSRTKEDIVAKDEPSSYTHFYAAEVEKAKPSIDKKERVSTEGGTLAIVRDSRGFVSQLHFDFDSLPSKKESIYYYVAFTKKDGTSAKRLGRYCDDCDITELGVMKVDDNNDMPLLQFRQVHPTTKKCMGPRTARGFFVFSPYSRADYVQDIVDQCAEGDAWDIVSGDSEEIGDEGQKTRKRNYSRSAKRSPSNSSSDDEGDVAEEEDVLDISGGEEGDGLQEEDAAIEIDDDDQDEDGDTCPYAVGAFLRVKFGDCSLTGRIVSLELVKRTEWVNVFFSDRVLLAMKATKINDACVEFSNVKKAQRGILQRQWARDLRACRHEAHMSKDEHECVHAENTIHEKVKINVNLLDVVPIACDFRNASFPEYHVGLARDDAAVHTEANAIMLKAARGLGSDVVSRCFEHDGRVTSLSKNDLLRLRWNPNDDKWVNDALANHYVEVLRVRNMKECEMAAAESGNAAPKKPTLFFSSYFMDTLTSSVFRNITKDAEGNLHEGLNESDFNIDAANFGGYNFGKVWNGHSGCGQHGDQGWKDGDLIDDFERLLIPINLNAHWTLVDVNFSKMTITYDDSYADTHVRNLQKGEFFLQLVKRFVTDVWRQQHPGATNFPTFQTHQSSRLPKQTDSDSCGLFMLAFAEHIARTGNHDFPHRVDGKSFQEFLGHSFRQRMILHLSPLLREEH